MVLDKYFKGFKEEFIEVDKDIYIHTVTAGTGKEAILFLHGHPETYLIWRFIAPQFLDKYTVVLTDLRGYGQSSKPVGEKDHSNYSKRVMAQDNVTVMEKLGFSKFHLVAHDRGARVAHRLVLDYPERLYSCTLMDILPTDYMYDTTNAEFATKYWHWFFYIQQSDFPERLLSAEPELFIRYNLQLKIGPTARANFEEDVLEEYTKYVAQIETVHGICEDYRASASIDRVHNDVDRDKIIDVPMLVLWGKNGVVGKLWDVMKKWSETCSNLSGFGVENCGHFVPEEQPEVVYDALRPFIEKNNK